MAKFPEDFEPVTEYVEDPKVYTCFCQKVEKTKAVTHADYMVLELENKSLKDILQKYEHRLQELLIEPTPK